MPKPGTAKTVSGHKLKQLATNNPRLALSLLLVVVAVAGVLLTHYQSHARPLIACGFRDDESLSVGSHRLDVEMANTNQARETGLSGRTCIDQNEGMLFVFNSPGYYYFWMKDMNFPIDMVWIGANHKAVWIEKNVEPSTYPSKFVSENTPAQYVLELASDRSASLGINQGTTINF